LANKVNIISTKSHRIGVSVNTHDTIQKWVRLQVWLSEGEKKAEICVDQFPNHGVVWGYVANPMIEITEDWQIE